VRADNFQGELPARMFLALSPEKSENIKFCDFVFGGLTKKQEKG
jgi:hypothetical protein